MLTLLAYLFWLVAAISIVMAFIPSKEQKEWRRVFHGIEAERRLKQQEYYANSPIIRFAKWLMIAMLVISAICLAFMLD